MGPNSGVVLGDLWDEVEVRSSMALVLPSSPFGCQVVGQGVGHEPSEGRGEVAGDDLVVVDMDVFEDGLVEFAPDGGSGLVVLLPAPARVSS